MKSTLVLLGVLIFLNGCKDNKSLVSEETSLKTADYLVEVDKLPELRGGVQALQKNIIYPAQAKKEGVEGRVILTVFLDEKGKVVKTDILKSDSELLEQAAIDAVEKAEFTPGIHEGKAVKTQVVVPIVFKLSDSSLKKENKYPEYLEKVDEFPMPVGGIQAIADNIIYPESEKQKGVEGQVVVLALISEKGDVVKSEIVKGVSKALDKAALEAINRTKFKPAKVDGTEVRAQVQIPVTFRLSAK